MSDRPLAGSTSARETWICDISAKSQEVLRADVLVPGPTRLRSVRGN